MGEEKKEVKVMTPEQLTTLVLDLTKLTERLTKELLWFQNAYNETIKNIKESFTTCDSNMTKIISSLNETITAFNKHVLEDKYNKGMNTYMKSEGFFDE